MKPIRCMTCNKVLGRYWNTIEKLLAQGVDYPGIFKRLDLSRYCCKKTVIASIDSNKVEENSQEIPNDNIKLRCNGDLHNFIIAK